MDGGHRWGETGRVATLPLPRWTADATVAMVARHYAPRIVEQLEGNPGEVVRLRTAAYSLASFGLAFPFLHDADALPATLATRYWPTVFTIGRERYRITSQWQERHRAALVRYITEPRSAHRRAALPLLPDIAMPAFAEEAVPFNVPRDMAPLHCLGDEALVRRVLGGLEVLPPEPASGAADAVFASAAAELRALARRTATELAAVVADARKDSFR